MEAEDHELAVPEQLDERGEQDTGEGAAHRQQARPAQVAGDDRAVLRRELEAARLGPVDELAL